MTPCLALQDSIAKEPNAIKSGIKPSIENMTVALFAKMQSQDMLSPFAADVAVTCPLRFCPQCQSLNCLTGYSEKILSSGHWDT
jgi:hypothetical protein